MDYLCNHSLIFEIVESSNLESHQKSSQINLRLNLFKSNISNLKLFVENKQLCYAPSKILTNL